LADSPALDLRWRSGTDVDELSQILYAALDDYAPVAIHELESSGGWRVFFRDARQRDEAARYLRTSFVDALPDISPVQVPDEEWARRSQSTLTAIRIGRIVVAPPWDLQVNDDGRDLIVVIDPSTGFGTGHHETTRLCLGLLQELTFERLHVIDVGTGSGVLAIAAASLGAAHVLALDEDPDALRNAAENVAANGVSDRVTLELADLASFHATPADLVLANLTGAVLQRHASPLRTLVARGGALIVSGFSTREAEDVAAAFGDRIERRVEEGDWCALRLRVTDSPPRS
jgi:ribosomal protein L11 methyltransferase